MLAEFWHTDRPVGRLRLETVPFGFIAVKHEASAATQRQEVFVVFRGTLNSQEWAANARSTKAQVVKGVASEGYIHLGFNSIFETSYLQRLRTARGIYSNIKRYLLGAKPPLELRQQSIRETLESILLNSELVHTDAKIYLITHQAPQRRLGDRCRLPNRSVWTAFVTGAARHGVMWVIKKIYITGHSLGGALALLAGRVIANSGRLMMSDSDKDARNPYAEHLAICSFAAPRVGDEAFKSVFKDITVIRYVNTEDIVPTVPPATSKLLGEDMNLTPEGLRAYKARGVTSLVSTYSATAGSVQRDSPNIRNTPFTHVGEQRAFTLSKDSISFNHNHQVTYRDGILLHHESV